MSEGFDSEDKNKDGIVSSVEEAADQLPSELPENRRPVDDAQSEVKKEESGGKPKAGGNNFWSNIFLVAGVVGVAVLIGCIASLLAGVGAGIPLAVFLVAGGVGVAGFALGIKLHDNTKPSEAKLTPAEAATANAKAQAKSPQIQQQPAVQVPVQKQSDPALTGSWATRTANLPQSQGRYNG